MPPKSKAKKSGGKKASNARGFATTSIPKKAAPEPAEDPSPATASGEIPASANGLSSDIVHASGNGDGRKPDENQFDPEAVEEQALQTLVDKIRPQADKEIARTIKVNSIRVMTHVIRN